MSKSFNSFRLCCCIVVCEATGIIGSFFTVKSIPTWYVFLQKPSFNPPNWLFAPVWTLLYLLMGISVYLVWQSVDWKIVHKAIIVFFIQLILNAIWTLIFFGLKSPAWAFIEIIALWICILVTIVLFWKISHKAAILLVPYALWVLFAAVLTYSVWSLNSL